MQTHPAIATDVPVSKKAFEDLLLIPLGNQYARAETIFDDYGPRLSQLVTSALLHANDLGPEKVEETLVFLERHWDRDLGYKHSEQKGSPVHNPQVFNMFDDLFRDILGVATT